MVTQIPDPQEVAAMRGLVDGFIQERLQLKLDKLKGDDDEVQAQRLSLQQAHVRETWLADAARRVKKIQLITHSLKGIHSAARGTNIYLESPLTDSSFLVGTHLITSSRIDDVISDSGAAYLGTDTTDAVELLKRKWNSNTLLYLLKRNDASAIHALSESIEDAKIWAEIFSKITDEQSVSTSHTLAKQIYFSMPDGGYHLLAPLFPSSLTHHLHLIIQEDRFSEKTRAAKSARKSKELHDHGYREHPNLVVRYLGGTKALNVSVLNNRRHANERGGANYLLASVPPVWKDQGTQPPLRVTSVFDKRAVIGRDRTVYLIAKALRPFLESVAEVGNNMHISAKRAELVQAIIDRVLDMATELQCLNGGWSADPVCKLSWSQKQWLDADALEAAQAAHETQAAATGAADGALAAPEPTEWRDKVAEDFARWLNATLSTDKIRMGDAEFIEWKHTFLEVLP
jgi:CRISPR-associated protein Csy1